MKLSLALAVALALVLFPLLTAALPGISVAPIGGNGPNATATNTPIPQPTVYDAPLEAGWECDTANMPDAMACQQLLAELDSSADDFIPQTPRSICAGSNKQKCCVSWSGSPTKNIVRKAKLALGLRNCQAMCGTQLSCRMLQWKLVPTHDGMVAASLCLSNRPKHCR